MPRLLWPATVGAGWRPRPSRIGSASLEPGIRSCRTTRLPRVEVDPEVAGVQPPGPPEHPLRSIGVTRARQRHDEQTAGSMPAGLPGLLVVGQSPQCRPIAAADQVPHGGPPGVRVGRPGGREQAMPGSLVFLRRILATHHGPVIQESGESRPAPTAGRSAVPPPRGRAGPGSIPKRRNAAANSASLRFRSQCSLRLTRIASSSPSSFRSRSTSATCFSATACSRSRSPARPRRAIGGPHRPRRGPANRGHAWPRRRRRPTSPGRRPLPAPGRGIAPPRPARPSRLVSSPRARSDRCRAR